MEQEAIFITIGGLFALGLAADLLGRRTRIPRVTLLILLGILVGPKGLNFLPNTFQNWYSFLSAAALTMVAFLLGGSLSLEKLARRGRDIITVSLCVVAATIAIVALGMWALGIALPLALLFAGIATATDPAATVDVVRQSGRSGRFGDTLLGVVAIDDAWGLIAFSLLLIAARGLTGDEAAATLLFHGLWELFGAGLVGIAVGVPAAYLTGRIRPGEPALIEALGIVFLCAGFSMWLGVSYLLAGMTAGLVIVNLAKHHERAFHEIELVEWPFMLLFFVLAGAALDLDKLYTLGLVGAAYIGFRALGRVAGGWSAGVVIRLPAAERRWIGAALMPQAGVAVGMALVAAQQFPRWGETLLSVTLATTVIFELIGPVLTMYAVERARGRVKQSEDET